MGHWRIFRIKVKQPGLEGFLHSLLQPKPLSTACSALLWPIRIEALQLHGDFSQGAVLDSHALD